MREAKKIWDHFHYVRRAWLFVSHWLQPFKSLGKDYGLIKKKIWINCFIRDWEKNLCWLCDMTTAIWNTSVYSCCSEWLISTFLRGKKKEQSPCCGVSPVEELAMSVMFQQHFRLSHLVPPGRTHYVLTTWMCHQQ